MRMIWLNNVAIYPSLLRNIETRRERLWRKLEFGAHLCP